VTPEGHIVTNKHVVNNAYHVEVTLYDGTHVHAEVVAVARNFDLAVLKIEKTGLTPVTMGDSDHVKVGETVVAIGNPLGLKQTVSVGVVSAVHRNMGFSDFDDLIQTDAAINPGNSGGPLFNSVGEVIGINQAIYTIGNGKGSIGLGFAISINEARYMIDRLRTTSTTDQGYLGFSSKVDARPRYRFILHQHRGSARNGSLARQRSIERWSKRR
jgi:S1-C subfamily serine protease